METPAFGAELWRRRAESKEMRNQSCMQAKPSIVRADSRVAFKMARSEDLA